MTTAPPENPDVVVSDVELDDEELYDSLEDELSSDEGDDALGRFFAESRAIHRRRTAPVDDSHHIVPFDGEDSSEDEGAGARVGDVPLEWYEGTGIVGYDKEGKPVQALGKDRLERFLAVQSGEMTVFDERLGKDVTLTDEQLETIRRIRKGEFANPDAGQGAFKEAEIDPVLPMTEPPLRRRAFQESVWEKQAILKLVAAIKAGKTFKRPRYVKPLPEDLWAGPPRKQKYRRIPPPPMAPPTTAESYRPPREFLLSEDEVAALAAQDPSQRKINFVPRRYATLRRVPFYLPAAEERLDRCLDLFLAPRKRKVRRFYSDLNELLPQLPDAAQFRPYPTVVSTADAISSARLVAVPGLPFAAEWSSGSDRIRWRDTELRCHIDGYFSPTLTRRHDILLESQPLAGVALPSGLLLFACEGGRLYAVDAANKLCGSKSSLVAMFRHCSAPQWSASGGDPHTTYTQLPGTFAAVTALVPHPTKNYCLIACRSGVMILNGSLGQTKTVVTGPTHNCSWRGSQVLVAKGQSLRLFAVGDHERGQVAKISLPGDATALCASASSSDAAISGDLRGNLCFSHMTSKGRSGGGVPEATSRIMTEAVLAVASHPLVPTLCAALSADGMVHVLHISESDEGRRMVVPLQVFRLSGTIQSGSLTWDSVLPELVVTIGSDSVRLVP